MDRHGSESRRAKNDPQKSEEIKVKKFRLSWSAGCSYLRVGGSCIFDVHHEGLKINYCVNFFLIIKSLDPDSELGQDPHWNQCGTTILTIILAFNVPCHLKRLMAGAILEPSKNFKHGDFLEFFFSLYWIQHYFIRRRSDSTVSEDTGIELRTVTTSALAVRQCWRRQQKLCLPEQQLQHRWAQCSAAPSQSTKFL